MMNLHFPEEKPESSERYSAFPKVTQQVDGEDYYSNSGWLWSLHVPSMDY